MNARRDRAAGVLVHPTSLPGGHGIGDLGVNAHRFASRLARAGIRIWQWLPLGPTGLDGSPYGSWSALAGNPLLIDLEDLIGRQLLTRADLQSMAKRSPHGAPTNGSRVSFRAVSAFKVPLLELAADRLLTDQTPTSLWGGALPEWLQRHAEFTALRHAFERPWWEWPVGHAPADAHRVIAANPALQLTFDRAVAVQWLFEQQLEALQAHCEALGLQLFGDVPIYVGGDSADVWANRELFLLDSECQPTAVSGVPPDAFSDTGQLWGNPLYDWPKHAATGFSWWIERIRRAQAQTSIVRIDHFRGLAAFWAVPTGEVDARGGHWIPGPGAALFEAIAAALGPVDIVAEDLGLIDDDVRDLQRRACLPGMAILQFAFGGGASSAYLPHNLRHETVCYTGTHDNNTTLGWWQAADERTRDHVRRYFGVDGHDAAWTLIRAALASVCDRAVLPLQDILGLAGDGRMNVPASGAGNWSWRFTEGQFTPQHATRLRSLLTLYDRI